MGTLQVLCVLILAIFNITTTTDGVSLVHDTKQIISPPKSLDKFINSPYKIKHLENSIFKTYKNVSDNPQTEETLYQISKDLVSAILSKLEIQDKITRITKEALDAPGKSKGISAIETRRILDYISRTLSGHILSITRASTEPELHRLVYGLGQIAAEVSIVSALKDITYATSLSKKQSVDLSLRKKRSADKKESNLSSESKRSTDEKEPDLSAERKRSTDEKESVLPLGRRRSADKIETSTVPPELSDSLTTQNNYNESLDADLPIENVTEAIKIQPAPPNSPYSIISRNERKPLHVMSIQRIEPLTAKGFLNQTVLDMENAERESNNTIPVIVDKSIKNDHYVTGDAQTLSEREFNAPVLMDEWMDKDKDKDNLYKSALNADVAADLAIDQAENADDEVINEKKQKQKLEKLEVKAKKAILYAGDVAYLAAASVVAMRRALTASIEVEMSVKYAKNGMSNHQDLMMNLAKTAAQQAGKEAKSATSKSLACERVVKLALKYIAQSHGANLNHVANRIVMDTISLATLAKSMAFVSSDIAINSLYQATDVKQPS